MRSFTDRGRDGFPSGSTVRSRGHRGNAYAAIGGPSCSEREGGAARSRRGDSAQDGDGHRPEAAGATRVVGEGAQRWVYLPLS